MLNCVTLMGRLTNDPVLKVTPSGTDVCSFVIAVDKTVKGKRQADFINIVTWGSQAKFVCDYFKKGSMIAVEGRIQVNPYTDSEGNKRSRFEIVAREVSFCEKETSVSHIGPGTHKTETEETNGYFATATAADFEEIVADDEY